MLNALRPVMTGSVTGGVGQRADARAWSHHWARQVVRLYGGGTLDYFALRDDKQHFFYGEIDHRLRRSSAKVTIVSPDPIGPESERAAAWAQFRRFAGARGFTVVVLGASAQSLRLYAEDGMLGLYIGGEAVVEAGGFPSFRWQAQGAAAGLQPHPTQRLHGHLPRPRDMRSALAESILDVMARGRIGEDERGFSMTLGRIFDPADDGLLLALATDKHGEPAAFCQYVPAPAINGYSLDLMRWDHGRHANGLIDFLIVSTLEELRDRGKSGLGLNSQRCGR